MIEVDFSAQRPMAAANENLTAGNSQQQEINSLREHFKDNIRILSSIGQFSYILKIRADQYDVSLTLQLDESYPSKAPEIIITAPRLAPDQILVVQRLLQDYSETLLNSPMILQIYSRLLKWFDENNIQSLHNSNSNSTPAAPRSPTNSKHVPMTNQPSRIDEIDHETSKKSSMKTAEDVISRIEWDERLDTRYFRVGYVDRFLGLQEKAFTEFDFKVDLSTISDRHSKVLAIPKHRIQYFKYNNEIIWDKDTRTDLMFGSTGNAETIYDVIERHKFLMENNHSAPSLSQDNGEKEAEEEEEEEENNHEVESTPLTRYLTLTDGTYKPNYFLSIPIKNPLLIENFEKYQRRLLMNYPSIFSCGNESEIHLTVLTFRIESSVQLDLFLSILKRLQEEIHYNCSYPERLTLEFNGVDTFYDRTIFVRCRENRRLENLRSLIVERFCEQQQKQRINGIYLAGNYAEFIPHLTLLKSKRKLSSVCPQEIRVDFSFGQQTIDSLEFSSIGRKLTDRSIFQIDLS